MPSHWGSGGAGSGGIGGRQTSGQVCSESGPSFADLVSLSGGVNYCCSKRWLGNGAAQPEEVPAALDLSVTGQGLDTQPLSSANSPQQWGDEAELCSINRNGSGEPGEGQPEVSISRSSNEQRQRRGDEC
uniref:Uncharacterized protein n=1 Tax=Macrostomum lignano TaxID=282301 RepID=A0A1I8FGH7_9PLAT